MLKKSNVISKTVNARKTVKVPNEILTDVGVAVGDSVIFLKQASSWVITTKQNLLVEAQEYARSLGLDEYTVDDFIAERRAEALKESE